MLGAMAAINGDCVDEQGVEGSATLERGDGDAKIGTGQQAK